MSAGEAAHDLVNQVIRALKSAQGWGVWDLIGGGLISTAVKHSHIDKAKNLAHRSQHALRVFVRELRDVRVDLNLNVDISGFSVFADYFFDGLIAD